MKKILIADDSQTMRVFIKIFMKHLSGVRVTEASDGFDAIEKIRHEDFDLIITDINMPHMDGLQLIRNIRGMGLATPIIVLSTRGEETDVEKGLSLGANDYMTKPISGHRFASTVMNYIGTAV
jgi:two-component system chemotaxis response regulator CheY